VRRAQDVPAAAVQALRIVQLSRERDRLPPRCCICGEVVARLAVPLGGVAPWVPFLYFAAGAVVSRLWAAGRERAIGVGDSAPLHTSGRCAATNGGRSGQTGSSQKRRSHNHQTHYKPVCSSSHSLLGD
jgi:hypothetical protein